MDEATATMKNAIWEILKGENERLAATLDAVGDGLIVTDTSSRVVLLNAAAENLLGRSLERAQGQKFLDVINVVDQTGQPPCPVVRVLEAGADAGVSRCVTIQSCQGELIQIEGSAAPQHDDENALIGAFFVFRDVSEREKTRRDLRRSNVRYESLIDAISQMVWATPPDGQVEDMPMWRDYTGQSLEEVRGWGWLDAIHPDDRERVTQVWNRAVESRSFYQAEYRIRHQSGEYRLFLARGVPIIEHNELREWIGVCNDIHDRKQAETLLDGQRRVLEMIARGEPLKLTLNALARLIENHSDALCSVFVSTESGTVLRNLAAPSLPIEYSMRAATIAVREGMCSCGTAAARRETVIVEDIETSTLWREHKDFALSHGLRACWSMPILGDSEVLGTFAMYYAEKRSPRDDEMQLLRVATNLAGIAIERERNETALLSSLSREARVAAELASILSCITDGVITADANGIVTFENEAARRIYGYSRLGTDVRVPMPFVSPSPPIPTPDGHEHLYIAPTANEYSHQEMPLARAVFYNEEVKDAELLVHQTNGKTVFVEANAVPVRGEDGAALGAVLTIRDVSAQRQLIREMLETNRSKDEFLAILSHELRTPLTPILGWASLLKQTGGKDPEMFAQAVDAIERNAQLQKRLVNDLLDTTRIVTDKLRIEKRAANLNELVKLSIHSVQEQAQEAKVHIEYSIDERLPLLQMDTERIQQVLMNLLSNSIKFSPENGLVKICTYLQMRRFDHASDTQYALVEIEDRGQGITPELLPHIFDLFRQGDSSFTRRHGGLGLGLAICKSLVDMHEGTIQALSEGLGRGAVFRVLLPIDKPEISGKY